MTDAYYVSLRNQANILYTKKVIKKTEKEKKKDRYTHLLSLILSIEINLKTK